MLHSGVGWGSCGGELISGSCKDGGRRSSVVLGYRSWGYWSRGCSRRGCVCGRGGRHGSSIVTIPGMGELLGNAILHSNNGIVSNENVQKYGISLDLEAQWAPGNHGARRSGATWMLLQGSGEGGGWPLEEKP